MFAHAKYSQITLLRKVTHPYRMPLLIELILLCFDAHLFPTNVKILLQGLCETTLLLQYVHRCADSLLTIEVYSSFKFMKSVDRYNFFICLVTCRERNTSQARNDDQVLGCSAVTVPSIVALQCYILYLNEPLCQYSTAQYIVICEIIWCTWLVK